MKSGSGLKPSVTSLKDRFPHLKKLTQEAGKRNTDPESPVASLMSRFPDLSFLGVKKEAALVPREEVTEDSPTVQLLTKPGQKISQSGPREPLSGQEPLAGRKESSPAQAVDRDQSCGTVPLPKLRPLPPRKSLPGAWQDASLPLKSLLEAGQDESLPRKSLLGVPPEVTRPLCPPPAPSKKVTAEDLFLSSVAMDDDNWLQFQVEEKVPAKEQVAQLQLWLKQNRPSQVHRSQGFGWIAVMLREKGKKVLEAKAAWEAYEGQKTMAVVNSLATKYDVLGGKWMCHLPRDGVDLIWSRVGLALLAGGLGQHVYMVKVSPVEDLHPEQSRGEHVLVVYNTDYTNTEQVMRVESLLRSAGVYLPINYKPDIFSTLGIYRNNRWGFRPTIYSSRALVTEGRSRVETVGTGKWFYNSSRGLQYPMEAEKENVIVGLPQTAAVEDNTNRKPVTDAYASVDSKSEEVPSLQEVKGLGTPSPAALPPLCVTESGNVKEDASSPVMINNTSNLVEEEESSPRTIPPADVVNVTKEIPKESKKNASKTQSSKEKSVESFGKKCSISDVAKATKKNKTVERITADADSLKMLGTKKETAGEDKTKMREDSTTPKNLNPSKLEKYDQPTVPPLALPRRVQPDWLAKLEELKMRSLDQF